MWRNTLVFFAAVLALGFTSTTTATPDTDEAPALWQERCFFDGLFTSRDRMARLQSDPALVPVMKTIAVQLAQQAANMEQIDVYMKAQADNLRYAFAQDEPASSLDTISANFETLAAGDDQIRNNLYYLTVRCRLASSQALPDQDIYQAALLILSQVQQLQLQLNALYTDAMAGRTIIADNTWGTDKHFRYHTDQLISSVVSIQDSVFAVYNAGYELAMRSK